MFKSGAVTLPSNIKKQVYILHKRVLVGLIGFKVMSVEISQQQKLIINIPLFFENSFKSSESTEVDGKEKRTKFKTSSQAGVQWEENASSTPTAFLILGYTNE